MKKIYVSVIMSAFNSERFLPEALESILNQTFKDFEFIIINDGSTDKTLNILKGYKDPRIKIINNKKNVGLTKSLNKGLKIAQGKYIARMDADDISLPSRLEKQVKFLDKYPQIGLVGSWYQIIDEKNKALKSSHLPVSDNQIREKMLQATQFAHGAIMFRKKCLKKIGFYREEFKMAQDYDFILRMIEKYKVANLPEFLFKWRFTLNSLSGQKMLTQSNYAQWARELAEQRKKFGKDNLTIKKDLVINKKHPFRGYYHWAALLTKKGNYSSALRLLLKSLLLSPLDFKTWILFLKSWFLLMINIIRKNKQ